MQQQLLPDQAQHLYDVGNSGNVVPVIFYEEGDELVHTDEHPRCDDPTCFCNVSPNAEVVNMLSKVDLCKSPFSQQTDDLVVSQTLTQIASSIHLQSQRFLQHFCRSRIVREARKRNRQR